MKKMEKSSWITFITALEMATKIRMCGVITNPDGIDWKATMKKCHELDGNRTLSRIRSSKIELLKEDGQITNLYRKGKVKEFCCLQANCGYSACMFLVDEFMVYYIEY